MNNAASPDWSRAFDERTLHDAGHYATALPKAVQQRREWQIAAEMLILVTQGQRPLMLADIAMRRALHAGKPAPVRERRRKPAKTHKIVRCSGANL
jgi:hypothetical protein